MKSKKKYLAIVEGEKMETDILEYVLQKYDFNVEVSQEKLSNESKDFKQTFICDDYDDFYIIQGPRNRIKEVLKLVEESDGLIERYFFDKAISFSGIFLVYDVDHNTYDELERARNKFNNISDGLLILSFPCIEAVCENEFKPYISTSYKKYKNNKDLYCQKHFGVSSKDYIKFRFNELMIKAMENNKNFFNKFLKNIYTEDVLNHIDYSLELNKRFNVIEGNSEDNFYVEINFYATLLYIIISVVKGFFKEENNYDSLLSYLKIKQQHIEIYEKSVAINMIKNDITAASSLIPNDEKYSIFLMHEFEKRGIISSKIKGEKRRILKTVEELEKEEILV